MQCFHCGKRLKTADAVYFEGDETMPVCPACYYEMSGQAMRDYSEGKEKKASMGRKRARRRVKRAKFPAERAKAWLAENIGRLSMTHDERLADGWEFMLSSARFYPRRDGLTISVKYRKAGAAWVTEDSYQFRLDGQWTDKAGDGVIRF